MAYSSINSADLVYEDDSVGYRVNGDAWKLYSKPLSLPKNAILEAKSVRYGWAESPVIRVSINASD